MSAPARLAAALISLAAWTGLGLEFAGALARTGSALTAAWVLIRYFTITTNLVVALLFAGLAAARDAHPRLVAGAALAIALVGAVYGLLLRGLVELTGSLVISNVLLHGLIPILVPLYWLAFTVKGALTRLDPPLWALYPLAYLVYALARYTGEHVAAYPFLDIARLGAAPVALTCVGIALGFVAAGYGLVWVDGRLGRVR